MAQELKACPRCGVIRNINSGKKRATKGTGLCRDCYLLIKVPCTTCGNQFTIHGYGRHRKACPRMDQLP